MLLALVLFLAYSFVFLICFYLGRSIRRASERPVLAVKQVENLEAAKQDLDDFLKALCLDDASLGIPTVITPPVPVVKPHQRFSAAAKAREVPPLPPPPRSRGPIRESGMYKMALEQVIKEQQEKASLRCKQCHGTGWRNEPDGVRLNTYKDTCTVCADGELRRKTMGAYGETRGKCGFCGIYTQLHRGACPSCSMTYLKNGYPPSIAEFERQWRQSHAMPGAILGPGPVAKFHRDDEVTDIMPYSPGFGGIVTETVKDDEYVAYNARGDVVFAYKMAPEIPTERAKK